MKTLSQIRAEAGRKGGLKGGKVTKEKYGKEHYSEIGRKGLKSRWNKTG